MKAMSKLWMALVVVVAVMAAAVPSWATPITTVSSSVYNGWIGSIAAPTLTSMFAFPPPGNVPPYDGEVLSTVYHGIGAAQGLFVYVYQVKHYSGSSEDEIDAISFNLFAPILTNPSSYNSNLPSTFAFQVSGTGDKALTNATLASPIEFFFGGTGQSDGLLKGKSSLLFGFFSSAPPTITQATVTDTGNMTRSPLVYTPSPEPSVGVMFGLGLLGLPLFRAVRRRFIK